MLVDISNLYIHGAIEIYQSNYILDNINLTKKAFPLRNIYLDILNWMFSSQNPCPFKNF